MTDMHRELKDTLRRKQPPPGFAERVLRSAQPRRSGWRHFTWKWLPAATAAGALLAAGGVQWQRQRQRAEAERTQAQLTRALDITAQQFARVQRMVAKNLHISKTSHQDQ